MRDLPNGKISNVLVFALFSDLIYFAYGLVMISTGCWSNYLCGWLLFQLLFLYWVRGVYTGTIGVVVRFLVRYRVTEIKLTDPTGVAGCQPH